MEQSECTHKFGEDGVVSIRKSPFSMEGDLLSCAWKKGLLVLSPIKFLLSFKVDVQHDGYHD